MAVKLRSLALAFVATLALLKIIAGTKKTNDKQGTCSAVPGVPGIPGIPGTNGNPGAKGEHGPQGPKGEPGKKGSDYVDLTMSSNWKQCAWKKNDDKDTGLIQDCTFTKKYDNTSLRIFYGGTLRINGCTKCCKRWYFTIDGAECNKPMAIDGIVYMDKNQNVHRHRHIEGYCNEVPKGHVRVGFWVGNCAGYGNVDAYSGWISVSRIVIEEVPPPQV